MNAYEAAAAYPKPPRPVNMTEQEALNYARELFLVYRKRSVALGLDQTFFHVTALIDLAAQTTLRGRYTTRRRNRVIRQIKDTLTDELLADLSEVVGSEIHSAVKS